jgi:hypothetical protein
MGHWMDAIFLTEPVTTGEASTVRSDLAIRVGSVVFYLSSFVFLADCREQSGIRIEYVVGPLTCTLNIKGTVAQTIP